MASISVGGGHGGKKAVDAEIPLVPFIDLLLCCVMFLLVTAVWNQMAAVPAHQDVPSTTGDVAQDLDRVSYYLRVTHEGYTLASSAGDRLEIPLVNGAYDQDTLRTRLAERRTADPSRHDLIVAPEDGVQYQDVIAGMDLAMGAGFDEVSLTDGAAL